MITRIVLLPLKKNKLKDFELVFEQISPVIRTFEGCLSLDLLREISDSPATVNWFTLSKWKNQEALNNYLRSPFFMEKWPQVKTFLFTGAKAWSLTDDVKN